MDLNIEKNYMQNIKNWIIRNWIFLIIIVLLLGSNTFLQGKLEKNVEEIELLTKKVEFYTLKDGTKVASVKKIEVSKDKIKEIIKKSDKKTQILAKKFDKIDKISKTEQVILIDSIKIPLNDTISSVKMGEKIDPNFSFSYKITNKSLEITNFTLKDTLTKIGGIKKSWFLGKETSVVDEIHSNKYVNTNNSTEIVLKKPKKWYESKLLWFAAGAITVIAIK